MDSTASRQLLEYLRRATATVCLAGGMLLSTQLYAQSAPIWTDAVSFGGSGTDNGQAVKVDSAGHRYVTGDFSATASFPLQALAPGAAQHAPAHRSLTSAGGMDIFLAKYDETGNLRWVIQAGGTQDDQGFDIGFDKAGNVYLAGMFFDSATFRGTDGATKTVSGVGETIFLAKYTPAGVLVWLQTGATGFDSSNNAFGVAVEPVTGSVYITGITQGDTTFSSANHTTHVVAGPGSWHMFLVKFDTNGNFKWGQYNAADGNTVAHKVAVDANNNPYVVGWMEGDTTFHSSDGHDLTVHGFSNPFLGPFDDFPDDAYIAKYDANGNLRWVNHLGGYKAIATDVATSPDGKVTVTGFVGNVTFAPATTATSQPGGNNINLGGGTLTVPYNKDVFITTYDGAGVLLDARRYGGAENDGGSGVAYDSQGKLFVAGIFESSTLKIDRATLTANDPSNLFVAKFAPNGQAHGAANTLVWAKAADGPGLGDFENDPRLGVTAQGDVVVTGPYEPTAVFRGFRLNTSGADDGFLSLLGPAP